MPGADAVKIIAKNLEFACCSGVIAVSHASAAFLRSRYRLPKLSVVHNGIKPSSHRSSTRTTTARLRVLFIGALSSRKGIDVLLEACDGQEWDVMVAGTGPDADSLRRRATSIEKARIEFCGWVDDATSLMQTADVLALPSRAEAFGYVLLEAMSAGLPVVATNVEGPKEIIEGFGCGLLVDPGSVTQLRNALEAVRLDSQMRLSLARGATARAADFTLRNMVEKTEDLYRSSISQGR